MAEENTEQTTESSTEESSTEENSTEQTIDESLTGDEQTTEMSAEEKAKASKQESQKQSQTDDTDKTGSDDEGLTGDDETSSAKTGDEDEESTATVEAYADIEMPDGVEFQTEYWGKVQAIFAKGNVSAETVQELVNLQGEQAKLGEAASTEAFEKMTGDWLTAAKADKEIGGDRFKEVMATAKVGLSHFGTPELTKLLKDYGLGKHPEIIRAFYKAGATTLEDNPGGGGDTVVKKEGDLADRMYGTNTAKQ